MVVGMQWEAMSTLYGCGQRFLYRIQHPLLVLVLWSGLYPWRGRGRRVDGGSSV